MSLLIYNFECYPPLLFSKTTIILLISLNSEGNVSEVMRQTCIHTHHGGLSDTLVAYCSDCV